MLFSIKRPPSTFVLFCLFCCWVLFFFFDQIHTIEPFWIWHHRRWDVLLQSSLWWHLWAMPHSHLSRWVKAIQHMGKLKCWEPRCRPWQVEASRDGVTNQQTVQTNTFNSWMGIVSFEWERERIVRETNWIKISFRGINTGGKSKLNLSLVCSQLKAWISGS